MGSDFLGQYQGAKSLLQEEAEMLASVQSMSGSSSLQAHV